MKIIVFVILFQSKASVGERMAVSVSHVETPDEFFFQLDTKRGQLDSLMDSMFEHFSSLPEGEGVMDEPKQGDLCAALYEDESWYRVKVMEVGQDESIKVSFLLILQSLL